MLFVNEIGEIVHSVVDQFSGAANKNIGDAFLLVWKYQEEDIIRNIEEDKVELRDLDKIHQQADLSVIAFLKTIAALNKSRKTYKYR